MTENNNTTDETAESEEQIDYDQMEAQIEELHDQLDQIKMTGENLGNKLSAAVRNNPERTEREQRIMRQAFLLFERVEKGDRAIVRGK